MVRKNTGRQKPLWTAALLFALLLSAARGENTCDHQWTLLSGMPPTCTEAGQETLRCALCGTETSREIPAPGHLWDKCIQLSAATCTEDGVIRCFCARDESHYKDEVLPPLGHEWTDWTTVKMPTLTESGLVEHQCSRCGATEQMRIQEKLRRKEYALALETLPAPEGGRALSCALVNTGKQALYIPSWELKNDSSIHSLKEPLYLSPGGIATFPLILPDEGTEYRKDIRISFPGTTETGEEACISNTTRISYFGNPQAAEAYRVTQEAVSEPSEAAGYGPKDVIRYTVTVTNLGSRTLEKMILQERETEEKEIIKDLKPGESQSFSREYRVTERDVLRGYICRTQQLWEAGTGKGKNLSVFSGILVFPAGIPEENWR